RISSSPDDTTVILVNLGSAVIPAVMLSMLYPRRLNSPDMRLNTPGLLSTSKENTCFLIVFSLSHPKNRVQSVLSLIILSTVCFFVKKLFAILQQELSIPRSPLFRDLLCQIVQVHPPLHLFIQFSLCLFLLFQQFLKLYGIGGVRLDLPPDRLKLCFDRGNVVVN